MIRGWRIRDASRFRSLTAFVSLFVSQTDLAPMDLDEQTPTPGVAANTTATTANTLETDVEFDLD